MDKVFVERLSVRGKHGVHMQERVREQEFLLSITAECDTSRAIRSDDIADAVDYRRFCDIAREVVAGPTFYLIEKLADTIARKILEDTRIASVEVTIRKPEALENSMPGVRIIRSRT
jgi:dihydroneopterin aldolase